MRTLKIGIAGYDGMKATHDGNRPRRAQVGSGRAGGVVHLDRELCEGAFAERNRELLAMIGREKPGSVTELAEISGRSKSNLSRTLKTMSHYGLVELKEGERGTLVPRTPYSRVRLDVALMPRRI